MGTMFDDVEAKCPFFLRSSKKTVTCEGIVDGCTTAVCFESKYSRDRQREVFCNMRYQNCEIYQMLINKYEK